MTRVSTFFIISFLFILSCEDKEDIVPITFTKTLGGSGSDSGNSVQQTTDGGSDVYLIKTDSDGNVAPESELK